MLYAAALDGIMNIFPTAAKVPCAVHVFRNCLEKKNRHGDARIEPQDFGTFLNMRKATTAEDFLTAWHTIQVTVIC